MSFLWYSMGWASSGAISTASLIFQIRAKTATALQLAADAGVHLHIRQAPDQLGAGDQVADP